MRSSFRVLIGMGSVLLACSLPLRAVADDAASGTTTTEGSAASPQSNPALNGMFSAGAELGAGILGSGGGSHLNWGLAIDGRVIPNVNDVTVGLFYNHVSRGEVLATETTNGTSIDANLNFYGVQGDYFLTSWIPGAHVGAKLALGNDSVTTNGVSNSSTDLYIGPKVAYDAGISNQLTAGVEGSMLFSSGTNARTTTSVLATLKYWLG